MNETRYQRKLVTKLKDMFPGCEIIRLHPASTQGYPDLLILFNELWAALEVKKSKSAAKQPNQDHYVCRLNTMSFASFIHPENEGEVLSALQSALRPKRQARISQSK